MGCMILCTSVADHEVLTTLVDKVNIGRKKRTKPLPCIQSSKLAVDEALLRRTLGPSRLRGSPPWSSDSHPD